jgi:hypothetical protein
MLMKPARLRISLSLISHGVLASAMSNIKDNSRIWIDTDGALTENGHSKIEFGDHKIQ